MASSLPATALLVPLGSLRLLALLHALIAVLLGRLHRRALLLPDCILRGLRRLECVPKLPDQLLSDHGLGRAILELDIAGDLRLTEKVLDESINVSLELAQLNASATLTDNEALVLHGAQLSDQATKNGLDACALLVLLCRMGGQVGASNAKRLHVTLPHVVHVITLVMRVERRDLADQLPDALRILKEGVAERRLLSEVLVRPNQRAHELSKREHENWLIRRHLDAIDLALLLDDGRRRVILLALRLRLGLGLGLNSGGLGRESCERVGVHLLESCNRRFFLFEE